MLYYLEMLKWAATSPQVSQSSPVILYMLTSPFTSLAIAGVTLVPGEREYIIGRSSSFRTCARALCISVLHCEYITWISLMLTEERHCSVPLKQQLSHLDQSHHQIHNHVSLKKKKKRSIWIYLVHGMAPLLKKDLTIGERQIINRKNRSPWS